MRLARRALTVLVAAVTLVAGGALVSSPAHAAPPASMAAMGDSITRGFNACGFYFDCTARSFATGTDSGVNSHARRLGITSRAYNVGRSGARAADMPGQADAAVARGVQYVTLLIGANDACTSSESSMTPVATFRAQIDTALARLKAGLPGAQVAVISVPDIKRLWEVGRTSSSARTAWSLFGICRSMLANPTSTATGDVARRDRVRQRVVDFNAQLAAACAAYGSSCDFDGNAVFNYPFTLGQLSGWDYFHPNTAGQAVLASVSFAAGPYGG
jgi:lysophospholipase L1-like esterase